MNTLKVITIHKTFETYFFDPFEFSYQNVVIRLEMQQKKFVITLTGHKSIEKILKIFYRLYDLLFIILGGFPKRECVLVNDLVYDTSQWIGKFDTASHYIEKEARLCEISIDTINEDILQKMSNVHYRTLSSIQHIISENYKPMVTDHKIELIAHTIEALLIHTTFYDQLLHQLQSNNSRKTKVDYIESVERIFVSFFKLHRKYNCQVLRCIHVRNKNEFYKIIADTRNDFSHILEKKPYRLIKGVDMAYFIDLILYAERLFMVNEILGITIAEVQAKEYMYVLHDWVDELVNKRTDRIKSERYKKAVELERGKTEWNEAMERLNNSMYC